ncbi:autotransporter outer membrane beta-barrel domain-containing protein [Paenochrobactrum glaciei]|uniref:Autotransporter domain-containing protein n=1 Tax=Paenochrobactrum glaciei TaxID=486407 RepID=A0ABN1GIS5_9HYPH
MLELTSSQEWKVNSKTGIITQLVYPDFPASISLDHHQLRLTAIGSGNAFILNGTITGTGSLAFQGAGLTYLEAVNTYSGGNFFEGGSAVISNDANLGDPSSELNFNSGTLKISNSLSTDRDIILQNGGGTLDVQGNRLELNGQISGDGALHLTGAGELILNGENTSSGGFVAETGLAKANIATHAFGSGILTVKNGATVDFMDFNQTVGGLSGDGEILLGHADLTLEQTSDANFSGTITGGQNLIKTGETTQILSGSSHYQGDTFVHDGILAQGAFNAFNALSAHFITAKGALDLGGFSTALPSLSNEGELYFNGTGGTILQIHGDYQGSGTIYMNSVLADDSSKTDMLLIGGHSSGTSTIIINNRGGLGAQTINGIKLIEVAGTANGNFELQGDYVTKDGQPAIMTPSAYAYTLRKNTKKDMQNRATAPESWYLVSEQTTSPEEAGSEEEPNGGEGNNQGGTTPRYSPSALTYQSYTATLQNLNQLPSLRQRTGNRYFANQLNPTAFWARTEAGYDHLQSNGTTGHLNQNINTYRLQAGIDGQFYEEDFGKLIASLSGQYGKARARIDNVYGDGTIDSQALGLSGALTWYGSNGFYLDSQAQSNWFESDLSVKATKPTLARHHKGFGYALSIEAGQNLNIDEHWSLTPQAQFIWSSVDFKNFTDPYGAVVENRKGERASARIGLALNYDSETSGTHGSTVKQSLYGIANLHQDFSSTQKVKITAMELTSRQDRTWAELGGGGSYSWNNNSYKLYGEGMAKTSLNHFGKSYSVKGSVGFKVNW